MTVISSAMLQPMMPILNLKMLSAEVESAPSQYLPIVMGDLNALVGTAKMGNERFMGMRDGKTWLWCSKVTLTGGKLQGLL